MRVLIINKFLYPNGGSETYIFKLGEALEQHGHEVQYFGMEHEGRCVGNRVNGIALLRLSIPTWTISTFCLRPHHKYNYPNWLTIIKLLLLDLFVKTLVSNSNRIIGSHIFGAIVTLCVAFRTEQNRL